jgi:hypothetical protein
MICKVTVRKAEFHVPAFIRNLGLLDFIKIAITYMNYSVFSYIGKLFKMCLRFTLPFCHNYGHYNAAIYITT